MHVRRFGRWVFLTIAALVAAGWQTSAWAAGAAREGVVADEGPRLSWQWLLSNGGWLVYVLAAMSVLGMALIIYFFIVLRRDQIVPHKLRNEVLALLRNGSTEEVRTVCKYKPCPFAVVVVAALDYVKAGGKPDPAMLKEVLEGEGGRQAAAIQTQTQYLYDVGVIAPMVGLLGTVFGMVHAFGVVAIDVAKAKPMLLAAGVAEALVNTAGGLIVGIPAMMFYAYFRGRAAQLISDLESASMELLTVLVGKNSP
jgi:biopolymer transport protein ExbB